MTEVPAANPVTTPVLLIVAIVGDELTQVPVPPSLRVVVDPTHTLAVPVIGPGTGRTVTVAVAFTPPQGEPST
jgi:hypothetical protein